MQIFWVDKDSNISFTSDENHPMSRGIKQTLTHTTTEKPQNQRKYDDRDETINFHSENVMYSYIPLTFAPP